ncbi:MAG: aminotransferase class I/II-fold pyridoxal phosphate-dependent enzyme [Clostridiales bacterium]|jgi:methionine-gamma-lyase|nr:aminotransferase class I/II-fold pyridoxal phosphate-dependent enzyme [Clostridiales bacterium]
MIYQTSTFTFENVEQGARRFAGLEPGYIYTRIGNPNMTELQERMASLENGEDAVSACSGMAAISTALLSILKQGDHIVASNMLYGCTYDLISQMLPDFGIEASFVDASDTNALRATMRPNTKALYIETPANPTMKIIDIRAAADISHEYGAYLVVDNTFMTPYLQRPLELGADIVVHSATKYLGGHGDLVSGVIVGPEHLTSKMKKRYLKDLGGIPSPFDIWLLARGIKTLGVRMDRHCQNAMLVAEFLVNCPQVATVYYPGLPSHPQHELAKKQMDGFGGMVSFDLKGGLDAGCTLMNNVRMISLAVSLGSVDSLIEHPASMTHACVPQVERHAAGLTDGLVRLSVGIEDVEDIISDLKQALDNIK